MQSYHKQKDEIFEKHKIVYEYFLDNKTDKNLDEIYKIINQNTKNNPYNIYVTDDNFIVKNTTYKKDLHLDLNFAKDTFLEHKQNEQIGLSFPIYEFYSSKFFSYSDQFLPNSNSIMQVSYTYEGLSEDLDTLKELLHKNIDIKNLVLM